MVDGELASSSRCRPRSSSSCTPSDPSINRGYAARGTEALSYSIGRDAPPDLFEAFNIGEDEVDYSDPFYAAAQHGAFAPNIWPAWRAELASCARRVLPRRHVGSH